MKTRQIVTILLSFAAGAAVGLVAPRLIRAGFGRLIFSEHRREIARITSPDGTVDAVMEGIDCGAPCSSGYSVSIVPKGGAPPKDPAQQVLVADDVVNAQIRWKEPHLLDITYDKAIIHDFHNMAYPFGKSGDERSWRYAVQVQLIPSSPHFSDLNH